MQLQLAFTESHDGKFIVLCTTGFASGTSQPMSFLFETENVFLESAVAANLLQEDLVAITTTVILSIAQPIFPQRWTSIRVNAAQQRALGLLSNDPIEEKPGKSNQPLSSRSGPRFPIWSFHSARQLQDFLMDAPSPFLMLKGPEHILTFINPPYMQLIGRDMSQNLLGLTVREFLPELAGQPFFALLDQVYRTGVPYVGKEVFALIRNQQTGKLEDRYFDFAYHPTHDSSGSVFGIFVQAHDVTAQVISRYVHESREAQLYRQWAELDTMYRTAPVGMCLVSLGDYRILRINNKLACLTNDPPEKLIGRRLLQVFSNVRGVEEQLLHAAGGRYVRNFEIAAAVPAMPGVLRQWLVNFGPQRGAGGLVEAIAVVSLEVTDRIPGRAVSLAEETCDEMAHSRELSSAGT